MGKPKKGSRKDDDFDSDNDDMGPQTQDDTHPENTEQVVKKADKKKNKKKGKQKDDDDWGESESNAKTLDAFKDSDLEDDIPVAATKKNKNKKKGMSAFAMLANIDGDDGGDDDFSDKDMEEEPPKSKAKAKGTSAFAMLSSMDDDVQMDDDDIDDKKSDVEENSVKEVVQQPKKKEKTKKSKKKEDEEDIDAILADIEKPASKADKKKKKKNKGDAAEDEENNEEEAETPAVEVEKMESKVVTIDDLDDEYFEDEKKKKKKNKKKGKEEEAAQETKETEDAEGGDEDEFKMKSAAQKKKEKKEREKQKKLEEKQKQLKKDQAKKEKEGTKEAEKSSKEPEATASHEATPEADEGEGGDGQEKAGKKKRKKKVEKEKEKEEEKVKPKNKQIAALREALRIQKEEEELAKRELERFRLEEEERIRLLEEEEQRKEEAKKKKKDAKKEREAQLKKEGKWLTAKQRQDKQKLEQMLEAMKMTGVEVGPRAAAEKPSKQGFVYTKKKRPTDNKEKSPSEPTSPTEGSPEVEMKDGSEEAKKEVEVTIEVKEEEVKDAWDADSDEGEEEEDEKEDAVPEKSKAKPAAKKEEEEEDDDDDDDDDDESEEESSEEESSEEETDESESESDDDEKTPIDRGREKVQKRAEKAEKVRTLDHLRAPVVCVLGHVDTGKTKILDKLRRTNVQDGEAGGITQQIGATNVPKDAITEKTKMVKEFAKQDLKIPGLLIIDTPGHESFSNLRIRGSSLCDIAILVIDIMHGLEPQTRESINLLKDRKTPFLVALNKVDRLYQWKAQPMNDVQNTVKKQSAHTKAEFDERTQAVIVQLAEEGLNAALFYENKNQREYVSMVPTSAHTGDGMGNLVALVCDLCQNMLAKRLMYSPDLQATVMEVKAITGMGTTIDVILINGSLNEGDSIVLAGTEGPIVTQIRGLLMPQPMKELRVKNQYEHHKTVMAAQGVKINAKEMEKALAGLPLFVAHDTDERDYYKDEVSIVLKDTLESIKVQDKGVFVQASTLGSLEALLEFLRTSKIPYAGINIGPVHKKDIMKASVMLEHDSQYAVILAFDVKVEREAQDLAENVGVRIFTADIIYHLFDSFMKYREDCKRQKQEEFKHIAVFPCRLKILPQYIFNSRDPIVMGVIVESGFVKEGTPICVPTKEFVDIGRVGSLELNHKQIDVARQGQEICIKILPIPGEAPKMYGRHFEDSDMLVSKISRTSIDAVKDYFRDEMTKQDWKLMVELKKEFAIL